MTLRKSDLYGSLWKSCDELRGGMDATQYKDYILTLLFVKYVSDKQKADPDSLIEVPPDGSFDDMIALKGNKEIGNKINQIIAKLAEVNGLQKVIDQADFNDPEKLGEGKEMQDRLSKLVAIFDDLDFRGSRAEGDDLLGDGHGTEAETSMIRSSQRDGLHELVLNHLAGIGDISVALEQEGDPQKAARLAHEYERDFRLLADIGWEPIASPGSAPFELTMPEEELLDLLNRLAREAGQLMLGSTGSLAEDATSAQTEERIECGYQAAVEIGESLRAGGGAR